ncbi:hypothetical protein Hte_009300 [Hypoxylon texense]
MATKTRKISQRHWDAHKDTILNLRLDRELSMKKLVETMDHDHGLTATISQFKAQLRAWKARKNVRMHKWGSVLETIDSLTSRGIKSRVFVSGQVVSVDKIRRARRYYKADGRSRKRPRAGADSNDNTTDNENTKDVVIESPQRGHQE